jgi:hypothetical protein
LMAVSPRVTIQSRLNLTPKNNNPSPLFSFEMWISRMSRKWDDEHPSAQRSPHKRSAVDILGIIRRIRPEIVLPRSITHNLTSYPLLFHSLPCDHVVHGLIWPGGDVSHRSIEIWLRPLRMMIAHERPHLEEAGLAISCQRKVS